MLMIGYVLKKIFGSKNERELKRMRPLVERINSLEPSVKKLSDAQLAAKTGEFKQRLENGEPLDDLLPEAFAVVREASVRTTGMRPFDVQLMGGIVLHRGKIAEMKTGEGKTLVATMPVYLNALTGKGVHVVTVNDYLAKRDTEWMGQIYRFLGMSVGTIVHGMSDPERKRAYGSDITYGTNNEFGFDYLRDNMKFRLEDYVQRELHYAIVDEVDSILIDEARTPLIISGPAEESTDKYYVIDQAVRGLKKDRDFTIDEKGKNVLLTDEGIARIEERLGVKNLYDPRNMEILHHVNQALKAHHTLKRDVDYVVKDGEVIIVDEFTGRLMPGRRWSDGLHQAVEAKEGVKIENENQTLATITFQNYFRMYEKLAGMTGTADTEAEEFDKIYNLEVVVIPTHKPMIRIDYPDAIYKTEKEKFEAVIQEIEEMHRQGRPVLVGTISIEKSEHLSKLLKRKGIPHNVLNAKHHEKEAEIIKDAGQPGAVTISTNMAGRGTDIVLGAGVADLGGLHIIGTERHESRRIDNQLRGRAGRQGDPGSSRFYLSLEDDLLRIFGGERLRSMMDRLGVEYGERIEHPWITKAIESSQRRVEGHNFDIRKHLLKYDDVLNHQRNIIYRMRRDVLGSDNIEERVLGHLEEVVDEFILQYTEGRGRTEDWRLSELEADLSNLFNEKVEVKHLVPESGKQDEFRDRVQQLCLDIYRRREKELGPAVFHYYEKVIHLQAIDQHWKDHLLNMDHLREGVGFEGYAQRDPLQVYQRKGFEYFSAMMFDIKVSTLEMLFRIRPPEEEEEEEEDFFEKMMERKRRVQMKMSRGDHDKKQETVRRQGKKIGRNDPCPCGSGKKYKKCCGRSV